jgi:hypothetical protein
MTAETDVVVKALKDQLNRSLILPSAISERNDLRDALVIAQRDARLRPLYEEAVNILADMIDTHYSGSCHQFPYVKLRAWIALLRSIEEAKP